jgi:hypothetical protein
VRRVEFAIRAVLTLVAFVAFVAIAASEQNPVFLIIGIVVAVIFLRFGRCRGRRRRGGHDGEAYLVGDYVNDTDGGWFRGDSGWFGGDGNGGNGGGNGGSGD